MNGYLLETIRFRDRQYQYLEWHQKRFDATRRAAFGWVEPFLLSAVLPVHYNFGQQLMKCRIIYSDRIHRIEWVPYFPSTIRHLQPVFVDSTFYYNHKWANREDFEKLRRPYPDADDVLIIKDGLVTDTSIANVAFFDGHNWVTPKSPLLNGTTRQRLISENKIIEGDIPFDKLDEYKNVTIFNAMIPFGKMDGIRIKQP